MVADAVSLVYLYTSKRQFCYRLAFGSQPQVFSQGAQLRRSRALRLRQHEGGQESIDARFMPTMAETVRGAQATLGTIGEARAACQLTSGRRQACELADAETF